MVGIFFKGDLLRAHMTKFFKGALFYWLKKAFESPASIDLPASFLTIRKNRKNSRK